jgi:hypothetical protein
LGKKRSGAGATSIIFALAVIAATVAFSHQNNLLSLIVIAPGYLVQAWLFERHWALGGAGYAATMIAVSALFWTLVIGITIRSGAYVGRRLRRSVRHTR